jgi:predicted ribosomally synthesized peptide with SipW-like signal peptide
VAVAAIVVASTGALFSDTETSNGNIFTAGSIDLKVDHTKQTYNGHDCVGNCVETGNELIANGGFETPAVGNGGYAIYPDASQTSWTIESGAGLEIQDHAAGDPHGGNQLAELDSTNSSAISQTLTTVAGGKYRLTFWYSPRPNIQAPDNTIGMAVKVVSGGGTIISDTIGASASGGSATSWTKLVYSFIAVDTSTKVIFSDLGINNSYGGYLDDISVKALNCTSQFEGAGICTLWGEKDLGPGDTFWNFNDIKPGDFGTNVISLHVSSNDAYACLLVGDKNDEENSLLAPEIAAGDQPGVGYPTGKGELSNFLNVFTWGDTNGDGVYNVGELPLGSGPLSSLTSIMSMDSGNGQFLTATTTKNIGLAWCAGTLTPHQGSSFGCDGSGMGNIAQSDSFSASLTAYAEQVRNNSTFSCGGIQLPDQSDNQDGGAPAVGPASVNLSSAKSFVIVSEQGITNTGSHGSHITGSIGASAITAAAMNGVWCSEIIGTIYGVDAAYVGSGVTTCFAGNPPLANKTLVDNAVLDMGTAYNNAAGMVTPAPTVGLGAGNIGGMTLAPGLYKWSTDVTIPTDVILSGGANDVWVFQIAGNLSIASGGSVPAGIKVKLSGGAQAKNVFWQVGGGVGATLGTYSTFNGTILSAKQVILQTGAVLNGRAFAQTQVTLDANVVTIQ